MKNHRDHKSNDTDELNDHWIYRWIFDENKTDETIYAVYEFLENLLMKFESIAFTRLRRYTQQQNESNIPQDASTFRKDTTT